MQDLTPLWYYGGTMTAPTVSINLRMPADLHARLKALAEKDHRSLNSEIIWLLADAIEALESDTQTPGRPPG